MRPERDAPRQIARVVTKFDIWSCLSVPLHPLIADNEANKKRINEDIVRTTFASQDFSECHSCRT